MGSPWGDFTTRFDFVWGMGQDLFQDKESLPQHAQAHTLYRRDVGSACSCARGLL